MDINRRDFVRGATATGVTLMAAHRVLAQTQAKTAPSDTLNIGVIGSGRQAREALIESCKYIDGVRIKAVCDIWAEYNRRYAQRRLMGEYKRRGLTEWAENLTAYEDYREMLDKEKDLDAVIVATPDFYHHIHTNACLEAGLHVYCEKEMSDSLEDAAGMVAAAKKTGKLLQIGHQRRSNPMYRFALELLQKEKICGQLTTFYGQWNKGVMPLETLRSERLAIPPERLAKYGYENMDQFQNWRWYRKYSAGPIADLGSHQIDIFAWFAGNNPAKVQAMASDDYFENREWFEDVLCLYEYDNKLPGQKEGSIRAFYQVLNTNSTGAYFERFSGDAGSLTLSENIKKCYFIPEPNKPVPDWMGSVERVARDGHQAIPLVEALKNRNEEGKAAMEAMTLPVAEGGKAVPHQFHLENFFEAVRANDKKRLTCPAEIGYETAVAVLNVIPAVEGDGSHAFQDADFHA